MFAPRRVRRRALGHATPVATDKGRGIRRNAGVFARSSNKVRRAPGERRQMAGAIRARTRYRSVGPTHKNRSRNFSALATNFRRCSKTKSSSSPNPRTDKILQHATQPHSLGERHSPLPALSPNEARTPRLARPHLENPVRSRRFSSQPGFLAVPRPLNLGLRDKKRRSLKTFPAPHLCPPRRRNGSVSDYATQYKRAPRLE